MLAHSHEGELRELIAATPWLMAALRGVRAQGLPSWCIGAGAIRNLVWDVAHGFPTTLRGDSDVDVVYFDIRDTTAERDHYIQAALAAAQPELAWEVVNQAGVHQWYEACYGRAIAPFNCLEDAMASWPETATAVGVWLNALDQLHIVAPYGLTDLFALLVRRSPGHSDVASYHQRLVNKRYAERWPKLQVLLDDA